MKLIWKLAIPVVLAVAVSYIMFVPPTLEKIEMKPIWWGPGEPQLDDVNISPYVIQVSDAAVEDLKRRLGAARFGTDLEKGTFEYGFQAGFLKEVQQHWLHKYDWRTHEAHLNEYAHFTTKIEGLDIHFLRAYPKNTALARGRVLLLTHGWPGSVWEFMKILPLLTDPQVTGGRHQDAFEVICPSIPGFGFSQAPAKRGFGVSDTARVFLELMKRLGHPEFYVQGGDYGAMISTSMAQLYPGHILGVHLNMPLVPMNMASLNLHKVAAHFLPSLFLDEADVPRMRPILEPFMWLFKEAAYFHLQATKPDTVAAALHDSPVGLAAYILEKFSTWTNPDHVILEDGGLRTSFSLDDLLTNVALYWFTDTIGSSVRFYKELFADDVYMKLDRYPVYVPSGIANFPHEITSTTRAFAAYRFKQILQITDMPRGGHFAAMEQPELLAKDIFSFVKKVEQLEQLGP